MRSLATKPQNVQRPPQSNQTTPGNTTPETAAPAHSHDPCNLPATGNSPAYFPALPCKLPLRQPGDPAEQQAEQTATQIMRMPPPVALPPGAPGDGLPAASAAPAPLPPLARKVDSGNPRNTVPPLVQQVLASPGKPLAASERAFMEPRFGHDFSQIRVHTDERASASARSVNALAYTVGRDIVFKQGQYAPGSGTGRQLLAHELTHTLQPAPQLARQVDDKDDDKLRHSVTNTPPPASAPAATSTPVPGTPTTPSVVAAGTPAPVASPPAPVTAATPPVAVNAGAAATPQSLAAPVATVVAPKATPGGHTPAPPGMSAYPDAPQRNEVLLACTTPPGPKLPPKEVAVLPELDFSHYHGDAERAKFARELARVRAERDVAGELKTRYKQDLAAAEKRAGDESKLEAAAMQKAAQENVNPKDRASIAKAKNRAGSDAKIAAANKLKTARAAVLQQDIAVVTKELAGKFEAELEKDYQATLEAVVKRDKKSWLSGMQNKLNEERKRLLQEKSARPKVAKGQTPPPLKPPEQIEAEVEAEMVHVRCERLAFVLNRVEAVSHAWAVGRREQYDYLTIATRNVAQNQFAPSYKVDDAELVQIPKELKRENKVMAGVAPELAEFLSNLAKAPNSPPFRADNRADHGGGSWAGQGFSTDIYLMQRTDKANGEAAYNDAPKDRRGFWRHDDAVRFLLALDATAKAMGATWSVLYNDFGVKKEVSTSATNGAVGFMGTLDKGGNPNWHGPDDLLLHFHLDLKIPKKQPPKAAAPAVPSTNK